MLRVDYEHLIRLPLQLHPPGYDLRTHTRGAIVVFALLRRDILLEVHARQGSHPFDVQGLRLDLGLIDHYELRALNDFRFFYPLVLLLILFLEVEHHRSEVCSDFW